MKRLVSGQLGSRRRFLRRKSCLVHKNAPVRLEGTARCPLLTPVPFEVTPPPAPLDLLFRDSNLPGGVWGKKNSAARGESIAPRQAGDCSESQCVSQMVLCSKSRRNRWRTFPSRPMRSEFRCDALCFHAPSTPLCFSRLNIELGCALKHKTATTNLSRVFAVFH